MWIRIQRLDFVPLARISGAAPEPGVQEFLDRDLAEDLAAITGEMESDRAHGRRFASIVDLTKAPGLNAKQRGVVSAWMKDTRELSRLTAISTVFVAPSTLIRGVLTAIFWTQSFGFPYRVVASLDEAVGWSLDQIRATGLHVAPGTRQAVLRAFE